MTPPLSSSISSQLPLSGLLTFSAAMISHSLAVGVHEDAALLTFHAIIAHVRIAVVLFN